MEMEKTYCPVCGGSGGIPLHHEGAFRMVRCPSCQFIYLNPRPTEQSLLHFYQAYLPEDEVSIEAWQEMMRPVFRKSATLIRRHKERGKLLDVGTGFGFFLAEMKHQGWQVEGVEISQRGIDHARKALSLVVHAGSLEKAGFREKGFDVVTAFYLIEHLPDPVAFLKECYRILKPGGLLLLRYPHTTPVKNLLHILRIKNRLYDLPAHLSDFSPRMIQICLERVGFIRCQHWIGGYTLPKGIGKRIAATAFGNLAEALFFLSGKRLLFPGVSKTVLAYKGKDVKVTDVK
ncbi:MAG: methyltransferase domain-containing protein [Deltaproteobacteria bacterium]|nr:MAG: methyltransferase domain-containing protein [Deltaproteobacteria bacterium]